MQHAIQHTSGSDFRVSHSITFYVMKLYNPHACQKRKPLILTRSTGSSNESMFVLERMQYVKRHTRTSDFGVPLYTIASETLKPFVQFVDFST
ncbi:hypothetical protein CDAR_296881 [Caerostris darwini]|uniref:Uncharacterized protein n=1 Tax=Caerostris darwini TaxID=1538125 RepID=A0AAV4N6S9_9ARAC|nr:hypothetical protein CDAR_296881 [Caerostris darwini]